MKPARHSLNRRRFLADGVRAGVGLSFLPAAFRSLHAAKTGDGPAPGNPKPAKAVIYLYMTGGMTHLDTFDVKPNLAPALRGTTTAIPTSADGIQLGNWLPQMAKQMHHVAVINSMTSTAGAHAPGNYLMHTNYEPRGTIVHPALGSWMQVLKPGDAAPDLDIPRNVIINGSSNHPGAGFLPAKHGPLMIGNPTAGLEDVEHRGSMSDLKYRLGLAKKLDAGFQETYRQKNVQAYREMYAEALELMESEDLDVFDLDQEPPQMRESYGKGFGEGCLLARRLVERGVSFVEVNLDGWDTHNQNFLELPALATALDRGMSSLIADLHERGMLEETLVVLATEFGRTPRINQNEGRDHFPQAFTCLLAGGGVRGGVRHGRTDESASEVIDSPVTIADFNATIAYGAGLPLDRVIHSPSMRPFTVAHDGQPVISLFS